MRRHEFWYWLQVCANVSQLYAWSLSLIEICPLFPGARATKVVFKVQFLLFTGHQIKWKNDTTYFQQKYFFFVKIFVTKPLLSKNTSCNKWSLKKNLVSQLYAWSWSLVEICPLRNISCFCTQTMKKNYTKKRVIDIFRP